MSRQGHVVLYYLFVRYGFDELEAVLSGVLDGG